ncbi:hypothetical protein A249_30464 [Pseudomonas syringae pv. actinidiae ICMP 18804]|uniref:Uncharacterized protein n=4 Tax=Pseudomonas syringae TaxID=317 RepID=A0A656K2I6_PSESF|nr:hypothetical protein A249_30464 [Pseudomonas syringae pv. actinidiae ICMP 18804]EPN40927.1 hypothetical protein A244_29170 [Pseudomonas syringae pv. actinidiae ICMP 18807]EPN64644.1 hypothetical protein A245_09921 [Pseudomonas syringae pv. actinidiae ICMP 19096]MBL3832389.1 hypothetical protein [Pseudomonas syringae pv. theae]RMQ36999.1 hypothetical protein ALQ07_04701 [Pseudomonas syringae pv. actinidiae]
MFFAVTVFDCRSADCHFHVFLPLPRLSIFSIGAYYPSVLFVEIGNALSGVKNRHWVA